MVGKAGVVQRDVPSSAPGDELPPQPALLLGLLPDLLLLLPPLLSLAGVPERLQPRYALVPAMTPAEIKKPASNAMLTSTPSE